MFWKKSKIQRNHEEDIASRRSGVRRVVTYIATGYAFIIGGFIVLAPLIFQILYPEKQLDIDQAKELYLAILPIATGVITYWFATRRQNPETPSSDKDSNEDDKGKPEKEGD